MRALFGLVVVVCTLAGSVGCPAPVQGEVVTCHEQWTCKDGTGIDTDVADSDKVFCTDPESPERAAEISAFQKDFASTCAGVQEQCVGGVTATCTASCVAKGVCDIAKAERVKL